MLQIGDSTSQLQIWQMLKMLQIGGHSLRDSKSELQIGEGGSCGGRTDCHKAGWHIVIDCAMEEPPLVHTTQMQFVHFVRKLPLCIVPQSPVTMPPPLVAVSRANIKIFSFSNPLQSAGTQALCAPSVLIELKSCRTTLLHTMHGAA